MQVMLVAPSRLILLSLLVFLCVTSCAVHNGDSSVAVDRAREFLTNVHTGREMNVEEWMTREAREAPAFKGFGGLPRMVKNTTDWANKYGGLRDIQVMDVSRHEGVITVKMHIHLQREYRDPTSPVVSERDDKVWDLRLAQEDGVWKIAP